MATRKQLITVGAGVAVVGILSYLGYKIVKQIGDIDLDDFMEENIYDFYDYRSQDLKRQKGNGGS
jgi:hypothetical protein